MFASQQAPNDPSLARSIHKFSDHEDDNEPFLKHRTRAETDADQSSPLLSLSVLNLKRKISKKVKEELEARQISSLLSQGQKSAFPHLLENHAIPARTRAFMVDWMVEVLGVFEQPRSCLFKALLVMDRFLCRTTKKLSGEDLHLIGAVSMLISSKFEAVEPIQMEHFEAKICKKKFSREQILEKELEIFEGVGFSLNHATVLEFLSFFLSERFLKERNRVELVMESASLICLMSIFSVDILKNFGFRDIALCAILISISTINRLSSDEVFDKFSRDLIEMSGTNKALLNQKVEIIRDFVLNFENIFPFVKSLSRFYDFERQGANSH